MSQALRVAVVAAAALGGALAAWGCALAIAFELDGFGRGDAEPRPAYIVLMGALLVGSLALPGTLWQLLLGRARGAALGLTAGAAALVLLVLGLSLR